MSKRNKILVSISIIVLFIVSLLVSYAFFSARIYGNESTSTIVGTAAYLELTFSDGNKQINASNIVPGWSDSKTFSVENTGEETAYYIIKITDITNPFVYGGINYKIDKGNTSVVAKETLPLDTIPVTSVIEIPVNTTHEYTITTYYDSIEESQKADLGKSFSYSVTIEAVYKKEISYIEDLVDLSNEVNNGNTYAHTWFLQTKDLDFNNASSYRNANDTITYGDYNGDGTVESIKTELTTGSGFKPIGTDTNKFQGSYDGQNYMLNNLFENNVVNQSQRLGLFGYIVNSTICNLTVSGNITNTNIARDAGGIIGGASVSTLFNLTNNVNVSSSFSSKSIGGIIGSVGNAYIKNVVNNGDINNGNNTGGIAGLIWDKLNIENSHNDGAITNNLGRHAGGLLGRDNNNTDSSKIYNSYNTGDVDNTRTDTVATYVGGLAGLIQGETIIKNSYNTGNVTRTATSSGTSTKTYLHVGGIGGLFDKGVIENCHNTGTITGGNRTGGIIGRKNSTANNLLINKCYNTGSISTDYINQYTTTLGGIIGYAEVNRNGSPYILNSYNSGNISGTVYLYAGGIIGNSTMITYIINSYNIGNISGNYAGGIIANNQNTAYINNIYNIGTIAGSSKSKGLFTDSSETTDATTVFNAYYLNNITGTNINGVGTSKTSAEIASTDFVNELNQNKRAIDLSTIYDGALSDYADFELSDWKYDSVLGYPILDN